MAGIVLHRAELGRGSERVGDAFRRALVICCEAQVQRSSSMSHWTKIGPKKPEKARNAGVPRSMKMGNIASPWRYDADAGPSPQSSRLRRPAMLHSAFLAGRFTSVAGPVSSDRGDGNVP